MLARIRKAQDNNEGFTLIELLVVMVIIGILAAIAIPSFLAQRDKGYQAAEKSDLKHYSIAEESYATDNDGAYFAAASAPDTNASTQGYIRSSGVTVVAATYNSAGTGTGATVTPAYCLTATHSKTSVIWYFDSVAGSVTKTKPANCI